MMDRTTILRQLIPHYINAYDDLVCYNKVYDIDADLFARLRSAFFREEKRDEYGVYIVAKHHRQSLTSDWLLHGDTITYSDQGKILKAEPYHLGERDGLEVDYHTLEDVQPGMTLVTYWFHDRPLTSIAYETYEGKARVMTKTIQISPSCDKVSHYTYERDELVSVKGSSFDTNI
jgi:antitoxin component YwqK of YwqJK toxin-antitoxin module